MKTITVGRKYRFTSIDYMGIDPRGHAKHSGQTVTIIDYCPADEGEYGSRETWTIEALGGWRGVAYIEELSPA